MSARGRGVGMDVDPPVDVRLPFPSGNPFRVVVFVAEFVNWKDFHQYDILGPHFQSRHADLHRRKHSPTSRKTNSSNQLHKGWKDSTRKRSVLNLFTLKIWNGKVQQPMSWLAYVGSKSPIAVKIVGCHRTTANTGPLNYQTVDLNKSTIEVFFWRTPPMDGEYEFLDDVPSVHILVIKTDNKTIDSCDYQRYSLNLHLHICV